MPPPLRLHLQPRCGQNPQEGDRTVPRKRQSRIGRKPGTGTSEIPTLKFLGRHIHPVLVNAGKHRASHAKSRRSSSRSSSSQARTKGTSSSILSLVRARLQSLPKARQELCRYRAEPALLRMDGERLEMAYPGAAIQGYADGVFWERNTSTEQKRRPKGR